MSKTLQNLVSTCFKYGKQTQGVITTEQALVRSHHSKTLVTCVSQKHGVYFFTDNHCFGYPYLPNDFVPCTSSFPMKVAPREGLEDGWIQTIEQYIAVFHYDEKQISTLEELVALIDGETK